jgi:hypothetical protein
VIPVDRRSIAGKNAGARQQERPARNTGQPNIRMCEMPEPGEAVPGLYAGVALDGLDDGLSTTERFLLWPGHGRPP